MANNKALHNKVTKLVLTKLHDELVLESGSEDTIRLLENTYNNMCHLGMQLGYLEDRYTNSATTQSVALQAQDGSTQA